MTAPCTRADGRLPRSAKARNRGRWSVDLKGDALHTLWGAKGMLLAGAVGRKPCQRGGRAGGDLRRERRAPLSADPTSGAMPGVADGDDV